MKFKASVNRFLFISVSCLVLSYVKLGHVGWREFSYNFNTNAKAEGTIYFWCHNLLWPSHHIRTILSNGNEKLWPRKQWKLLCLQTKFHPKVLQNFLFRISERRTIPEQPITLYVCPAFSLHFASVYFRMFYFQPFIQNTDNLNN